MKFSEDVPFRGDREVFVRAVHAELDRILASEAFKGSAQNQLLLRTIVNESLAGRTEALKEVVLAKEVFGRPDYDPSKHTVVRVAMSAVRKKLAEYFENAGAQDEIRITIPRGHYVAEFSRLPEKPKALPKQFPSYLWAACIAGLLAFAVVFLAMRSLSLFPRPAVPVQLTFDTGWTAQPSISRDGSVMVYTSDRGSNGINSIWIQQSGKPPRPLTKGRDMSPDLSPDGRRVAFRSWRSPEGIWAISANGGDARLVAQGGYSPRFSPDGASIAFAAPGPDGEGHIFVVPSHGGAPRQIDSGTLESGYPVWSPDGSELVFVGRPAGAGDLDYWTSKVNSAPGERSHPLGVQAQLIAQKLPIITSKDDPPADWIGDRLLFATHRHDTSLLYQVPLEPSGKIGRIQPIPSAVDADGIRALRSTKRQVVFALERIETNIWTTNLNGSQPLQQTTHDSSLLPSFDGTWPYLSGDGNILAFITERSGSPDICLKDLRTGAEHLLAASPSERSPLFLDQTGSEVVFVRHQPTTNSSVILRKVSENIDHTITTDCPTLLDLSRNFDLLLCADGANLFELPIGRLNQKALLRLERKPNFAKFSPDGRWIAYVSETGQGDQRAGFIVALDGSNKSTQICQEGYGLSLHWSPDGNGVYFWSTRDGFRCLYIQPLDRKTKVPIGEPVPVLHRHRAQHYPWSGGTLAVSSNRIAMTLKDSLANIWRFELPR